MGTAVYVYIKKDVADFMKQKLQLYLSIWEDVTDVMETEVTAVSVYLGRCCRCYRDRSYSCICLFGKMSQMLWRQKLQMYMNEDEWFHWVK